MKEFRSYKSILQSEILLQKQSDTSGRGFSPDIPELHLFFILKYLCEAAIFPLDAVIYGKTNFSVGGFKKSEVGTET